VPEWNSADSVLFTNLTEFEIKVGSVYYTTDSLVDLNINLAMLNDYWKSTHGKLHAAPINQFSKFNFSVNKTANFYSETGNRVMTDFRNNIFAVPPILTEITFKITGKRDNQRIVEEYAGIIDEISDTWTDTEGKQKITVSGTILSKS